MAIIKSGASTDQLTIDATAKAARVQLFDSLGVFTGQKPSYRAATVLKTATAADTKPFGSLYGSATSIVRVHRIIVHATVATAAVYGDIAVYKRTAVPSGGTATTIVPVALDSASAVSGATNCQIYTAGPTAGTGGGVVSIREAFMPLTGTVATAVQPLVFEFGDLDGETPLVLRGVAQGVELAFATTPGNIPTLSFQIDYTESAA